MTQKFLDWLVALIATGDIHPFYVTPEWRALSADVLCLDRYECQICKARGKYSRANMVHHVNHVKRRPELALDMHYTDADGKRKRNLISVCKSCHENVCHPERLALKSKKQPVFVTEERWD